MSHRINRKLAIQLYDKEQKLQRMQRQGQQLPISTRRHKKYIMMRKRQDGFLWKLKDRIHLTGGELPEHLKEKEVN